MPRFLLEIPAYHSVNGDVDRRTVPLSLPDLPRIGDQIEVPKGGIVEVVGVRLRPLWLGDEQSFIERAGGKIEANTSPSTVYTNWASRPSDAPQTRRPR